MQKDFSYSIICVVAMSPIQEDFISNDEMTLTLEDLTERMLHANLCCDEQVCTLVE